MFYVSRALLAIFVLLYCVSLSEAKLIEELSERSVYIPSVSDFLKLEAIVCETAYPIPGKWKDGECKFEFLGTYTVSFKAPKISNVCSKIGCEEINGRCVCGTSHELSGRGIFPLWFVQVFNRQPFVSLFVSNGKSFTFYPFYLHKSGNRFRICAFGLVKDGSKDVVCLPNVNSSFCCSPWVSVSNGTASVTRIFKFPLVFSRKSNCPGDNWFQMPDCQLEGRKVGISVTSRGRKYELYFRWWYVVDGNRQLIDEKTISFFGGSTSGSFSKKTEYVLEKNHFSLSGIHKLSTDTGGNLLLKSRFVVSVGTDGRSTSFSKGWTVHWFDIPSCPNGSRFVPERRRCEKEPQIVCRSGFRKDNILNVCYTDASFRCESGFSKDLSQQLCYSRPECRYGSGYVLDYDRLLCVKTASSNLCPSGFSYENGKCVRKYAKCSSGTYNSTRNRCEANTVFTSLAEIYAHAKVECPSPYRPRFLSSQEYQALKWDPLVGFRPNYGYTAYLPVHLTWLDDYFSWEYIKEFGYGSGEFFFVLDAPWSDRNASPIEKIYTLVYPLHPVVRKVGTVWYNTDLYEPLYGKLWAKLPDVSPTLTRWPEGINGSGYIRFKEQLVTTQDIYSADMTHSLYATCFFGPTKEVIAHYEKHYINGNAVMFYNQYEFSSDGSPVLVKSQYASGSYNYKFFYYYVQDDEFLRYLKNGKICPLPSSSSEKEEFVKNYLNSLVYTGLCIHEPYNLYLRTRSRSSTIGYQKLGVCPSGTYYVALDRYFGINSRWDVEDRRDPENLHIATYGYCALLPNGDDCSYPSSWNGRSLNWKTFTYKSWKNNGYYNVESLEPFVQILENFGCVNRYGTYKFKYVKKTPPKCMFNGYSIGLVLHRGSYGRQYDDMYFGLNRGQRKIYTCATYPMCPLQGKYMRGGYHGEGRGALGPGVCTGCANYLGGCYLKPNLKYVCPSFDHPEVMQMLKSELRSKGLFLDENSIRKMVKGKIVQRRYCLFYIENGCPSGMKYDSSSGKCYQPIRTRPSDCDRVLDDGNNWVCEKDANPCKHGNYNPVRGTCEYNLSSNTVCPAGSRLDISKKRCEKSPLSFACSSGTLKRRFQNGQYIYRCELPVEYRCDSGFVYDPVYRVCYKNL